MTLDMVTSFKVQHQRQEILHKKYKKYLMSVHNWSVFRSSLSLILSLVWHLMRTVSCLLMFMYLNLSLLVFL